MGYIAFIDAKKDKGKWLQIIKLPMAFARSYRLRASANKEAKKLLPSLKRKLTDYAAWRIRTKKVKF